MTVELSQIECDLLKAIEQNPNASEGYASLAHLLCTQNAWEKCLAVTNVGCEKFPRHAGLLHCRSLAFLGVGHVTEATKGFKAVIELDPMFLEGYEGLIRISTQGKQWTDCLAISSMAMKRGPGRLSFVMAKARALAELDHAKELKKVLTTYLRKQGFTEPPPLSPGFLAAHPNLPLEFFHLYKRMLYANNETEAASRLQAELDKSGEDGTAMRGLFGELDRFIPAFDIPSFEGGPVGIDSLVDGNDLYNIAEMVHRRAELPRLLQRRAYFRKDPRLTAQGIGVGGGVPEKLEKAQRLVMFLATNALKHGCSNPKAHILLAETLYELGSLEAAKNTLLASGALLNEPEAQLILKRILLEIGDPVSQEQFAALVGTTPQNLTFLEIDDYPDYESWCASVGGEMVTLPVEPQKASRAYRVCKDNRISQYDNTIESSRLQAGWVRNLQLHCGVLPFANGRGYYAKKLMENPNALPPVSGSSRSRVAIPRDKAAAAEYRGEYIVPCSNLKSFGGYFHLLCQVLSRILMTLQCPEAEGCGILLPAFVPKWGINFLTLAGVDEKRITVMPRQGLTRVEKALVMPFKWDVCPTEIAITRKILSERFPYGEEGVDYYLTRRGATNYSRSLSNEQEFIDILRARNFTIIDPLNYSLEEQMRLFSRARTIVTCGSSAYANMLYAKPGTRIIIIAPSLFWAMLSTDLATACGHDFSVLFGEFLAGERNIVNPHSPYVADPVAFEKLLDHRLT